MPNNAEMLEKHIMLNTCRNHRRAGSRVPEENAGFREEITQQIVRGLAEIPTRKEDCAMPNSSEVIEKNGEFVGLP